jgi:hypothetical protein
LLHASSFVQTSAEGPTPAIAEGSADQPDGFDAFGPESVAIDGGPVRMRTFVFRSELLVWPVMLMSAKFDGLE